MAALEQHGVSPNVGSFLGAGTLREYAKGMDTGPADAFSWTMRRVMAEAMEDGAFGVSYALIYPPDAYAPTDEIVEVCKVVARYGGVYITHMRSEADRVAGGAGGGAEIGPPGQPAGGDLPPESIREGELAQDAVRHRLH